ncbi:fatty acid desaturase [Paramyrothecium foliicola]|nr:fatty acid desaturase [Paramyrothecium foliicola]
MANTSAGAKFVQKAVSHRAPLDLSLFRTQSLRATMENIVVAADLTVSDKIVLDNLISDIKQYKNGRLSPTNGDEGYVSREEVDSESSSVTSSSEVSSTSVAADVKVLKALNDPASPEFEPSIISSLDLRDMPMRLSSFLYERCLLTYVRWARTLVRHETDVIMLTHLAIYFSTSVPSAILLFRNFTYLHGILHLVMQIYYTGSYTLMMHQHIHQNGILAKKPFLKLFDLLFPYITDPLMGHTWNTYFYHHVKHHHVEGNGPSDLSSTIRYQRDDVWNFLHYVARFYFLIWMDLPLYFFKKGQQKNALKAGLWELSNYAAIYFFYRLNSRAATFVFLCPLLIMRLGLMIGNWGQHAFVDADEPDSDFRSSITLIDVPSNRYCFNDGYHTSHHLNPRRHWRDHPSAFLQQKDKYIKEQALVFHNIDYLMITFKLLRKDYMHLAKCLVPMGDQIGMTLEERATMLRRHTQRFSEEEILEKFGKTKDE